MLTCYVVMENFEKGRNCKNANPGIEIDKRFFTREQNQSPTHGQTQE